MEEHLYHEIIAQLRGATIIETTQQRNIGTTVQHYHLDNHELLYKNINGHSKLVIPQSKMHDVLFNAHNHPLGGHMGTRTILNKLNAKYWWPGMTKDVQQHILTCDTCQKRRKDRESEKLQPIKPTTAFDHLGIDIMGPLPKTERGNRYIVVAIDYLTKWPEAQVLPTADVQSIAPFIYEDIICRHGIPSEITTDRGTEFVNDLTETLWRKYQVKHITTTAYHLQGNGLEERMNQTIKNILAKMI
jgi:hypothetical protein